jgi:hypothetical protein
MACISVELVLTINVSNNRVGLDRTAIVTVDRSGD